MQRQPEQRVIDALEAEGPSMPLAALARRLDIPPTRLVGLLDDLFDEGLVAPGRERGTVALVGPSRPDGRLRRTAPASRTRS